MKQGKLKAAPQPLLTKTLLAITLLVPTVSYAATDASTQNKNALDPVIEQDSQGFNRLIKDRLNIYVDSHYYAWKGDDDSQGHQLVTPITATYRADGMNFGLRTAVINSKNNSPDREGEVTALSDTSLSVSKTIPLSKYYSVRLNSDVNLPTGRESLSGSQKNAIMDGGLVQQVRFGEGLNATVGASVVHNLNDVANVGIGYSHTWLGKYDPNGDIDNDELNPGDQNLFTLQTHIKALQKKLALLNSLNYTVSDVTTFDGRDYYKKGNRLDLSMTGIYTPDQTQRVVVSARRSLQSPDRYVNRISGNFEKEQRNINGKSTYVSAEYAKGIGRHVLKANASWLAIDANSYDQANDLYNAGREKVTYGVGYEYAVSQKSRVKASLARMHLNDKATPATKKDVKYDGWNALVGMDIGF